MSATWYSKDIGDGVEAYEPTSKIQEAFTPLFGAVGCPVDMAVFSRYDHRRNIVTFYFSPAASMLAKAFSATPCQEPSRENLSLLVGDARCMSVLFPDT